MRLRTAQRGESAQLNAEIWQRAAHAEARPWLDAYRDSYRKSVNGWMEGSSCETAHSAVALGVSVPRIDTDGQLGLVSDNTKRSAEIKIDSCATPEKGVHRGSGRVHLARRSPARANRAASLRKLSRSSSV